MVTTEIYENIELGEKDLNGAIVKYDDKSDSSCYDEEKEATNNKPNKDAKVTDDVWAIVWDEDGKIITPLLKNFRLGFIMTLRL